MLGMPPVEAQRLAGFRLTDACTGIIVSEFGVELEEGVQRLHELLADFLFPTLQQMHGDVSVVAILQADLGVTQFFNFIGGEQP